MRQPQKNMKKDMRTKHRHRPHPQQEKRQGPPPEYTQDLPETTHQE